MKKVDIGVIVGRFQVATLSEGHRRLIEYVSSECHRTLIILGESANRVTKHDPLTVEMRSQTIHKEFPESLILSLPDCKTDEEWCKNLDSLISANIPPQASIKLYGSRYSFLDCYNGKFSTELVQESMGSISGTSHRMTIACKPKNSEDFRKGVIWATQNQYDKVQMMVDVAPIIQIEETPHIVLINKKSDGNLLRFIGGHIEPHPRDYQTPHALEIQAIREMTEESNLNCWSGWISERITYLGSFFIDDWRYQHEDSVISAFFVIDAEGVPRAGDDADSIQTVPAIQFIDPYFIDKIVPEHQTMAIKLQQYLKDKFCYTNEKE